MFIYTFQFLYYPKRTLSQYNKSCTVIVETSVIKRGTHKYLKKAPAYISFSQIPVQIEKGLQYIFGGWGGGIQSQEGYLFI